jgi:polar amino acid transport system substrate-binding protein
MPKISAAVVVIAAVLGLAGTGCGSANDASNDYGLIEPGIIHAVTQTAQPPFDYATKEGKPTGFVIDLANEAAKRLGLKIDYKSSTVSASLAGLSSRQYDLAAEGLGVTAEREKAVMFTKAVFWSTTVVLTNGGGGATAADFTGKRVGVVTGAAQEAFLAKKLPAAKPVKFPAIDAEVNQLLNGNLDAVALGGPDADAYIKEHPKLVAAMRVPVDHPTSMAVPKDHTKLRDALDKQLAAMVGDGTYAKLYKKYFHEPAQPGLVAVWPRLGDQLADA